MPRGRIKADKEVEFLWVLDKDGEIDSSLVPDLSDERLRDMHRAMLLARRFDERMLSLQRQGKIGTFAPVKGQEAAQIGAVSAIDDDDWLVPSYRETAMALWRGAPMDGLLLYNAGYNEGAAIPEDRKDLPIAIPVGSQMLHAVGIAYAARQQNQGSVALTCFGDGATSEGDFHEAMNFAAVLETPVIFLCQNNQWAISVPRERQTASKSIAQKALAYGMNGIQVDGNDLLGVHVAVKEAVARARDDHEPTLVECVTYRREVHTTADDPSRYRDDEEVEEWADRDPIDRFQSYLIDREIIDEEAIESWEEEIKEEIDAAWAKAQETMAGLDDPSVMFDHLYDQPPADLTRQRETFVPLPQANEDEDEGESDAGNEEKDDRGEDDRGAEKEAGGDA